MARILVAAYACNPYQGSEEGVGWGWVRMIGQMYETDVVTADFHRRDLERAREEAPGILRNVRFIFVPSRPWHYRPTRAWRFIEGSALKPIMNWSYRSWLRGAYRVARRLQAERRYDVVHQLTYVGFRFPGHLWQLGIPFVWGPIGGLENTPWRFLPGMGLNGATYYAGRNVVNSLHRQFLRSPKKAFSKARGGIIAATGGIQREIERWYGEDSTVVCEIGPPDRRTTEIRQRKAGEPLKLAWSGQHLPGKALNLVLDAVARLQKSVDWRLEILGDGPCRAGWERRARRLGVFQRCRFHGVVPRTEALAVMRSAHLFVISSLKDLTSTVLLEALAQGLPVVCPDHCGFADVVTAECGIKLPVAEPKQFSMDLADALTRLEADEGYRQRLAQGALIRVDAFAWERKAIALQAIYERKMRAKGGRAASSV